MPKRTSSYNSWQLDKLTNPEAAAAYLSAAMDDSPEMFRKALRTVAKAQQMTRVAKDAGLTREALYRATSEIGNPTLDTLHSVLGVLGLKIEISPLFEQGSITTTPNSNDESSTSASVFTSVQIPTLKIPSGELYSFVSFASSGPGIINSVNTVVANYTEYVDDIVMRYNGNIWRTDNPMLQQVAALNARGTEPTQDIGQSKPPVSEKMYFMEQASA